MNFNTAVDAVRSVHQMLVLSHIVNPNHCLYNILCKFRKQHCNENKQLRLLLTKINFYHNDDNNYYSSVSSVR